jgi:hypothetical protein
VGNINLGLGNKLIVIERPGHDHTAEQMQGRNELGILNSSVKLMTRMGGHTEHLITRLSLPLGVVLPLALCKMPPAAGFVGYFVYKDRRMETKGLIYVAKGSVQVIEALKYPGRG